MRMRMKNQERCKQLRIHYCSVTRTHWDRDQKLRENRAEREEKDVDEEKKIK